MLLRTSRWCSTLSISSVARPSSWSSYTSSCHAITLSSSRVPAEKSARSVNIWSQTGAVVSRSTSVCVRAPPASRTTNGSARNGTSLASLTVMSSGVTPDPMLIAAQTNARSTYDLEKIGQALHWRSSEGRKKGKESGGEKKAGFCLTCLARDLMCEVPLAGAFSTEIRWHQTKRVASLALGQPLTLAVTAGTEGNWAGG